MRKITWIGLVVAVSALAYAGCDAQDETTSAASTKTQAVDRAETPPAGALTLPVGSRLWETTEDGKKTIWFELPDGHAVLGRVASGDGAGTVTKTNGGGITCTCQRGPNDCSPFSASGPGGTTVGCAMGDCEVCQGRLSRLPGDGGPGASPLEDIVLIDLREPIALVETRAEAARLRCGSETLLDDPDVIAAFDRAVRPFQGPQAEAVRRADITDPDDDVLMAPFNVYGHIMWAPVAAFIDGPAGKDLPFSELAWDRYVTADGQPAHRTVDMGACSCRSGDDGCIHHSRGAIIGSVEWCEADGCRSCRLS